jgi:hypothetical protein
MSGTCRFQTLTRRRISHAPVRADTDLAIHAYCAYLAPVIVRSLVACAACPRCLSFVGQAWDRLVRRRLQTCRCLCHRRNQRLAGEWLGNDAQRKIAQEVNE